MKWCVLVLFLSIFYYSEQKSSIEDDHYVAAVVEYMVQSNLGTNLNNYVSLIQQASEQNADIIVFPEMTLTTGESLLVPINGVLKQYPVPALNPDLYDNVLVQLSRAARQWQIYVVVNFPETMSCPSAEEYCPNDEASTYVFNSNVVFDRNGAVIDRYRKINLFGEFTRTPALQPDLGVFSTDFGVTFGHYICFDLMFQVPSIQVVQKHNLTDVIFTTMWFSELPFLTAVEIQEAYAISANINFLAAGANNVRVGSAGSGIFSGKAGALISVMPGSPTTRLLVAKVPKVPGLVTPGSYPGPQYDDPTTQDNLFLKKDPSLAAHLSRVLEQGSQEFTLSDKGVSCKFRVNLNYRNAERKPIFRAFVRDDVNIYARRAIGVAACVVVACEDILSASCPHRYNSKETDYRIEAMDIELNTLRPTYNTTLKCDNSFYYPISVRVNKFPVGVSNFTYNQSQNGRSVLQNGGLKSSDKRIKMSLNMKTAQDDVVAFGIWGRIYERDTEDHLEITEADIKTYLDIENLIYDKKLQEQL